MIYGLNVTAITFSLMVVLQIPQHNRRAILNKRKNKGEISEVGYYQIMNIEDV